MLVTSMIGQAFQVSLTRCPELSNSWIEFSFRLGGLLPNSQLSISVQRIGRLDTLLRCMEDEFTAAVTPPENVLYYESFVTISELWIGSAYEAVRLLSDKKRKLIKTTDEYNALLRDLALIRMPIEKHEIASDKAITKPLLMKRQPPRDDDSDLYAYVRNDTHRAHIMPTGTSQRGSIMWQVVDVKNGQEYWIERRELADRMLGLSVVSNKSEPGQ